MSDDKNALLTIKAGLEERGKEYWKINNSILPNDDYIALIKNLIGDFENNDPKGHVTSHISTKKDQQRTISARIKT